MPRKGLVRGGEFLVASPVSKNLARSVSLWRDVSRSESECCAAAQAVRQLGVKAPKSQGDYPKPHDLVLGWTKPWETRVEVRIYC